MGVEDPLGMVFSNSADRALRQQNAIVLDYFIHRLGKGYIRRKIRDHPLQGPRCASMANVGASDERPYALIACP
jgi:hypothetical protein